MCLLQYPGSRLGALARATTHQEIIQLTSDYSLLTNEYFFDRLPPSPSNKKGRYINKRSMPAFDVSTVYSSLPLQPPLLPLYVFVVVLSQVEKPATGAGRWGRKG
jgi:hypothetical protein